MSLRAGLLGLLAGACASSPPTAGQAGDTAVGPWPPGPSPYGLDDELRFHQVQALATHNSYHLRSETLFDPSHDYDHAPLTVQLADYGVRGFELDLHLHQTLGWQVFHLPGLDAGTTCLAFADCLGELLAWSDQNPWHLPLMIWLEPKDDVDALVPDLLPFADRLDELEQAVLDVVPRRRVVTPDSLRGDFADLPSALRAGGGWPALGQLRGRFVFALLDSGEHRARYLEGAPALEGRLFFVTADSPTDPYAAVLKINDAPGEAELVAQALEAGQVVTSNVDSAAADDATNAASLAAALAAGANFLASDYPGPVEGRSYVAAIPGGQPANCHPWTAPPACEATEVEALSR